MRRVGNLIRSIEREDRIRRQCLSRSAKTCLNYASRCPIASGSGVHDGHGISFVEISSRQNVCEKSDAREYARYKLLNIPFFFSTIQIRAEYIVLIYIR